MFTFFVKPEDFRYIRLQRYKTALTGFFFIASGVQGGEIFGA